MNMKNIDKLPANAQKVLEPFLNAVMTECGENVVSIVAYGSVTGPDYNPKTSDINIAVVLKDASISKLKPLLKTAKKGIKSGITAPLFLTPEYIKMSLDTFPIEFSTMKDSRCVLFGEDTLESITVDTADLRRECEYQLKGKMLMIRQAYLEQALCRKGIEGVIKSAFRSLMPVFKSILRIKTGQSSLPDNAEVFSQMGEEFGLDPASFLEVLRDKKMDGRIGEKSAELFLEDFLAQLERLSNIVDNL